MAGHVADRTQSVAVHAGKEDPAELRADARNAAYHLSIAFECLYGGWPLTAGRRRWLMYLVSHALGCEVRDGERKRWQEAVGDRISAQRLAEHAEARASRFERDGG